MWVVHAHTPIFCFWQAIRSRRVLAPLKSKVHIWEHMGACDTHKTCFRGMGGWKRLTTPPVFSKQTPLNVRKSVRKRETREGHQKPNFQRSRPLKHLRGRISGVSAVRDGVCGSCRMRLPTQTAVSETPALKNTQRNS